jgi:hypothetical protein
MSYYPSRGTEWQLCIGPMSQPKKYFNGLTIEECIVQVEELVSELAPTPSEKDKKRWEILTNNLQTFLNL